MAIVRATDGIVSLLIDEEVNGERAQTSRSSISQPTTFPEGTDYTDPLRSERDRGIEAAA